MTLALQVSLCPSTQKSGVVCGQRAKQRLKEKERQCEYRISHDRSAVRLHEHGEHFNRCKLSKKEILVCTSIRYTQ
jgi:hypothetical protein